MEHRNDCLLCGMPLKYWQTPRIMHCVICGKAFEAEVSCERGHYVCDACHSGKAETLIMAVCNHTTLKDPIAIMQQCMDQPCVHMHGPEHHFLTGAALLAAYAGCGGAVDLERMLPELLRRSKQVPGGACGAWGCCGAAISAGIFLSLVTGNTPLSSDSWGTSMALTAKVLERIAAIGGPRCCKRDSFVAAQTAAEYVKEHLGISMEVPEQIVCRYFPNNAQCKKELCPFYPATAREM